jgi:hypothetical protein
LVFALIILSSVAFSECKISARKWQLSQVEFDELINPATDILIKESKWKADYHVDKPDMAFNANTILPIPETEEEINKGAIVEWQVVDPSTGFRSGDEAIESTLIYFDAAGRWLPELDGLDPIEARKYNAVFYSHRKWDYNASKIVTVSDRVQFLGGAKFRIGYFEETEECYNEDGEVEIITFRTYGLIPGADFSKSQGGKSKPSGGGGNKPSGGGNTPPPGIITPPPADPTPTPPPECNEPDPQEDPIETLAPRNTPPPAAHEPNPEEDKIILAPRSDGKESSAPTAASSSTNVEASSSSSSSETTNTSSTTTTTTETSSTSDTSSTSSADTSNNGTPDDSSAAGQPNAVEDEIVLVPRGGG